MAHLAFEWVLVNLHDFMSMFITLRAPRALRETL